MNTRRYAADGVDIVQEASFSAFAGEVCRDSYANSPFASVCDLSAGRFRGPRPVTFKHLPSGYMLEASADGLGTKSILIDAAGAQETAAYDLVAMTATDITRFGGVPILLTNILDLASVGDPGSAVNDAHSKLLRGLGAAAKASRVVVLKGETAQMSANVDSEIPDSPTRFNWGAVMLGAYHKDKIVTGETISAGQKVVALKERGFRCNGISSVRKALSIHYGDTWWENSNARDDIAAAAAPSVLYDAFINTLHGWHADDWKAEVILHGIAHLSGGGIKEKFAHDVVIPRGLSAVLEELFEPPEIMHKCAQWRGIGDEEFYETWNGGQGALLVVDADDANYCVSRAEDFGLTAKVCGEIVKTKDPSVTLHSRLSGKTVVYA